MAVVTVSERKARRAALRRSAAARVMNELKTYAAAHGGRFLVFGSVATGEQWHKDVISRLSRPLAGKLARPALLSGESAKDIDETRRFRNLALRSYNSFEPARATPAVAAARRLMVSLGPAFGEFKRAVDPAAEDEVASSPTPSKK
jgi:hypothetical protein